MPKDVEAVLQDGAVGTLKQPVKQNQKCRRDGDQQRNDSDYHNSGNR